MTAAIDVVRPAAEAKGIILQWSLTPEAGIIKGDAGRLQQILWNLLTNAVKFTPRGGRVDVTLRREESEVEVEIADTGRGISKEFLSRVFGRFTQQEGSNARRSGGPVSGLPSSNISSSFTEARSRCIARAKTLVLLFA